MDIWMTREGKGVLVEDMEPRHLINSYNYSKRARYSSNGQQTVYWDKWIAIFDSEIKKRFKRGKAISLKKINPSKKEAPTNRYSKSVGRRKIL